MKAIRSLELNDWGLYSSALTALTDTQLDTLIDVVDDRRLFVLAEALRRGRTVAKLQKIYF